MREYLEPMPNGDYRLHVDDGLMIGGDWIEIPEGAYSLTSVDDTFLFWNKKQNMCMNPRIEDNFRKYNYGGHAEYFKICSHTMSKYVLWQREKIEVSEVVINDVDETLKERQSQYGGFEDVAHATQSMLDVLVKDTCYEKMPKPHKEAIHMILSKVSRVACGDQNHKDSWHDIGGYAKLIENLIGES